jgi:signal transduction histidine kinase
MESERAARLEAERAEPYERCVLGYPQLRTSNPLNAVLGWATTLRFGSLGTQELAQGLEAIGRNARVQAQIIDDLLDMSRIISGKVRLDVQRLDLPTIVVEAVETVRNTASAKGRTLAGTWNR